MRWAGSELERVRILRLTFEKYGAFQDRELTFRPDASVHVIFGRNEAGKSAALAGVSDLLFGFPHQVTQSFRFLPKDLRIGGTLLSRAGERVEFRRRRGTKGTLLDAADAALRDDLLAPFLGGLTREVFTRAFGLNAASLRSGAEDLLSAGGEAGASLFAAASGLKGLEVVRRRLEEDAEAIFAPQARIKPFNEAMRRHDEARRSVKEKELRVKDWAALNARLDELSRRLDNLGGRRADVRTRRARLERLSRAAPALRPMDDAFGALAAFDGLSEVGSDAVLSIKGRLDAAKSARLAVGSAGEALVHAEAEIASLEVDLPTLEMRADIEQLVAHSGAYAKGLRDLLGVQREADGFAADLDRLAARLGLPSGEAVGAALPTDADRAALREVIERGRTLAAAEVAREETLAGEMERKARLEAERGERPDLRDPRPLREACSALAPELRRLERRTERAAEHAAEARALTAAAARLAPPVEALDRLAGLPTPSSETVAKARTAHDACDQEIVRLKRALSEVDAEARKTDADLAAIAAGAPIASRVAIASARGLRDEAWMAVRSHVLEEARLRPGERDRAVAAVDRHLHEADRLADNATADASRVALQEDLVRRRAEIVARREVFIKKFRNVLLNFSRLS